MKPQSGGESPGIGEELVLQEGCSGASSKFHFAGTVYLCFIYVFHWPKRPLQCECFIKRGSKWGLVFSVVCPYFLMLAVKLANFLMFTVSGEILFNVWIVFREKLIAF